MYTRAEIKDIQRRAGLLVERVDLDQFYDINEVVDIFLDNWRNESSDVSLAYHAFSSTHGHDPYELEDAMADDHDLKQQFLAFLPDFFEEQIIQADYNITSRATIRNGQMLVYRNITAPSTWIKRNGLQVQSLGIYWSYDSHSAEAHWGSYEGGNMVWQLAGWVPLKDIEWPVTLYQNASASYEDEKEIRVYEGTPITLEYVAVRGRDRQFHPIKVNVKGQRYPA